MKNKKSLTYYILIVIFLNLLSKILGLGRDTFIGTTFGAGNFSDAYFMGVNLTISLFLAIGSAVSTNLVPIVVKYRNKDDKPLFKIMFSLLIITSLIYVLYYFSAPLIIRLYARTSNEMMISLVLDIMRKLLPAIIFVVMTYFFVAVLQGNEIFILPAAIAIPFNMLFFLYLIFYKDDAMITGLAVVTTVAWALQLMVVFIKGISLVGFNNSKFKLREFYLPLIPIIIVALTHHLNLLIDTSRASVYGEGAATSMQYGNMLFKALTSTVVYGITAVMFPKFTENLLKNKKKGLNVSVANVLKGISLLLLPMSVGLIVLSDDFITVLFLRGNFDLADKTATVSSFLGYTSFMLAFGFVEVLNKAYYSLGNRKIPILVTFIITSINFSFSLVFSKFVNFNIIAIITSLAYFVGAIFSAYMFLRDDKSVVKSLLISIIKALVSSALMGVVVYYLFEFKGISGLSALIFGPIIGMILYLALVIILKEDLVLRNLKKIFSFYRERV